MPCTGGVGGRDRRGGVVTPTSRYLVSLAVAIGILLAWILFWPEPRLIVWPDSIGYLGPAVDAIERGRFTHWAGRGSGYPALLWTWLSIRPEPSSIVFAQRVLVLATFGCIAAVVIVLGSLAQIRERVDARVLASLAAFWLLAFALYPPVPGLAHLVMPEVLFALVLSIVAAGTVAHTLPTMTPTRSAAATAITVAASVALVLIKPHWLAGAVALPVALLLLVPQPRLRVTSAVVMITLLVSGVVLVRPELRLQARDDAHMSTTFGPRSLFCNSSDLVQPYLAQRTEDPLAASLSVALWKLLTPEARARAADWHLIGFDGDACMYGEAASLVSSSFAGRPADEASFYVSTYAGALAARPLYLPVRLAKHAWTVAKKPFNATSGDYFLRADLKVIGSDRSLRDMFDRWLAADPWLFDGMVELPTRHVNFALRIFFVIAGAGLTVMTLLAIPVAVTQWWRRAGDPLSASFAGLLFCAVALNILIVTVHTLEPRYLAMQVPLFGLLGFTASLVVAVRVCGSLPVHHVRHLR